LPTASIAVEFTARRMVAVPPTGPWIAPLGAQACAQQQASGSLAASQIPATVAQDN